MTCWDLSNDDVMKWKQIFSLEKSIQPIKGANNQLNGLIIDGVVHLLTKKLIMELSDNLHSFTEEISTNWISGPFNKLFYLIVN